MATSFSIPNTIFFSDFDGTISTKDSNIELVALYGNDAALREEGYFVPGRANNREVLIRYYRRMQVPVQQYYDLLFSIQIDPGFAGFYAALKQAGGTLQVLTGSGAEAIHRYLSKEGYPDIPVLGNRFIEQDGIALLGAATDIADSHCGEGLCAHCKSNWIEAAHREGKQVVYIGDGITDECAAEHADLVFAKAGCNLDTYCQKVGIPCIPFTSFHDITRYFFGEKAVQT